MTGIVDQQGPSAIRPEQTVERPAPLLKIADLTVGFPLPEGGTRNVLRSIDLDVLPGEILGLVGESGSGKTTLARSILGLPPVPGRISSGTIMFEGRDILSLPKLDIRGLRGRRLSVIVPNPRGELNPVYTVGDQIASMAENHLGISRVQARGLALEMLKSVQIPDPERRMNAYPHELSGGMAQRAVIAIALICKPAFVIADDATSGLDVTVQAQILDLLRELAAKQHSAMLFITRDVGITAHFCDRVAVLYNGEIMEIADREELFLRPRHPYTLMLLAAFSHNRRLRDIWTARHAGLKAGSDAVGCAYASRCPIVQPVCRQQTPPFSRFAATQGVRCHFPVSHP